MPLLTSYAQNLEDVILWRALKGVEKGFYIDIGAQDPVANSVSLAFYEHGWRGVHIEPSAHYAAALRRARPDETVIEAMVGDAQGEVQFFEIDGTGLSTGNPSVAARHAVSGRLINSKSSFCLPLSIVVDAYHDRDIHWLKIDVEGQEAAVIRSWGPSAVRPWIVVVESIDPLSHVDAFEAWEAELLVLGYTFVYSDGLNRFYVSDAHRELKEAFSFGPNIFDGFALSGTSSAPFCNVVKAQVAEFAARENNLSVQLASLRAETERLGAEHTARENDLNSQVATLRTETERLGAEHAARESDLSSQIANLRTATERLGSQNAARERDLGSQVAHLRTETERLGRQHAARERDLSSQVANLRTEIERLGAQHATRENDLSTQVAILRAEIERLGAQHATRENDLTTQVAILRAEIERLGAQHATRENDLSTQVAILRAEIERLGAHHATRENDLNSQIAAVRAEAERVRQEHDAHESDHRSKASATQNELVRLHGAIVEKDAWGEAAVRHVSQLTAEIDAIHRSTSWRITAPMRTITRTIARIRSLIVRAPGTAVRRTGHLVRQRAPRLYAALSTSRPVRAVYNRAARPSMLAPRYAARPQSPRPPFPTGLPNGSARAPTPHSSASEALFVNALAHWNPGKRVHE